MWKRKFYKIFLFLILINFLTMINGSAFAQSWQENWRWANPAPHGNQLNSVAIGNGRFVEVGVFGVIASSTDGLNWTTSTQVTTKDLHAVTWTGSQFVAVGDKGTVVKSADGEHWTLLQLPTAKDLYSISAGNGWLVVSSGWSSFFVSQDSVAWVEQPSGVTETMHVSFWNGTQFVAIGQSGVILTWNGVEGTPWQRSTFTVPQAVSLGSIAWNGSRFVGVGFDGLLNTVIASSPDGVQWTLSNLGWQDTNFFINVTWGNGRFIAVGWNGNIVTSTDGLQWSLVPQSVTTNRLLGVTWGNGKFVATGEYGVTLVSNDGLQWSIPAQIPIVTPHHLYNVSYSGSRFVAVGDAGVIFTSRNGKDWQPAINSGTSSILLKSTQSGGRFIAVGFDGTIVTSTDARNWSAATPVTTTCLTGVAGGNGTLVAVGSNGIVLTSTNGGNSWSKQTLRNNWGDAPTLLDVVWGASNGINRFVAVGLRGQIWSSIDGIQWTAAFTNAPGDLHAITWKPGTNEWVATGDGVIGIVQVPPDGAAVWLGTVMQYRGQSVIWNPSNSEYMEVGGDGTMLTSPDGINWTVQPWFTNNVVNSIAFGNGQNVIVGGFGTILYGSDLIFKDSFDEIQ